MSYSEFMKRCCEFKIKNLEIEKCNCKCYEEQIKELETQIYDLKKVIKTLAKYIK